MFQLRGLEHMLHVTNCFELIGMSRTACGLMSRPIDQRPLFEFLDQMNVLSVASSVHVQNEFRVHTCVVWLQPHSPRAVRMAL